MGSTRLRRNYANSHTKYLQIGLFCCLCWDRMQNELDANGADACFGNE